MLDSIFKDPTLIGYLVKKLKECFPNKQVGKTVVQKMVYLLVREGIMHFDYSMYHHGPYSSAVSGELNFAENSEIVNIEWIEDKGYSITPGNDLGIFEDLITDDEKVKIDEVIQRFGNFGANELSLIATALYLKDNFNVSDDMLPDLVHNIKEQYDTEDIRKILQQSGTIELQDIPF